MPAYWKPPFYCLDRRHGNAGLWDIEGTPFSTEEQMTALGWRFTGRGLYEGRSHGRSFRLGTKATVLARIGNGGKSSVLQSLPGSPAKVCSAADLRRFSSALTR
jgi:hypothetical protein